jgi:hypothetical protein
MPFQGVTEATTNGVTPWLFDYDDTMITLVVNDNDSVMETETELCQKYDLEYKLFRELTLQL